MTQRTRLVPDGRQLGMLLDAHGVRAGVDDLEVSLRVEYAIVRRLVVGPAARSGSACATRDGRRTTAAGSAARGQVGIVMGVVAVACAEHQRAREGQAEE